MAHNIVVSDALNRRVKGFDSARYQAFTLAVSNVAKGRIAGKKVHTSPTTKRDVYLLECGNYNLYYSLDPTQVGSLVFEEFLSGGEEDRAMELFAEGADELQ